MLPALCLGLALASPGRILFLERTEYASARGALRLVVDPTERQGSGAGWYRMSAGESVLWQGRLPFTLQKALVAESGVVVGYAFTHGALSSRGHLIAVRIDESGTACVVGSTERKPPCCPDSSPEPAVARLSWLGDEAEFAVYPIDSTGTRSATGPWVFGIDEGPPRDSTWTGWSWGVRAAEPPSRRAEIVQAAPETLPARELEPLAPVVLGGDGRWPFERANGATLLADGGYALLDALGVVWCFGPDGSLRSRSSFVADGKPGQWRSAFLATPDGCAIEDGDRWIALDGLGRCTDVCDDGPRRLYARRRPVLSGVHAGAELSLGVCDAELRAASGEFTARFERSADQRWIDSCTDAAVTENGWVGVLDWRTGDAQRTSWLHLYDPDGVMRRSLDLGERGSVRDQRVRVAGDRLLVDRPGFDALLVDPERDELGVFRPAAVGGRGSRIVAVVPSPDGASIAVFESGWAVVRRFAWPTNGR